MKPKRSCFTVPAIACLFIASELTSCKKDDDALKATEEKIRYRWNVSQILINEVLGGQEKKTIYTGEASDYVDFHKSGRMYTNFMGHKDTSSYKVLNEAKIDIDNDEARIEQLTDSTLVLFSRDETGTIGSVKITYYLRR